MLPIIPLIRKPRLCHLIGGLYSCYLMLFKSLLQRNVLTLVKSILGGAAKRGALIETLVVLDPLGSTFVSVQERNIVVVQLLLGG